MEKIIEYLKNQLEIEKNCVAFAQNEVEKHSKNACIIEEFLNGLEERTILDPPN